MSELLEGLEHPPRQQDITREIIMKPLSHLATITHKLALGLFTIIPLLCITPNTYAETNHPVEFSQAELDQMLAPIALYPDALLSQVLIASTYPLEIVQADRWVRNNRDLKADDALKFAENKDWDPSVKSLVAFPDVLQRMSDDIDWTQRLGDAFLSSENDVMDTVQRLRKRAYAAGNLDKAQHIRVERDDSNIVIEPAEERIVYVPVYDTRVVYGNWWWPDYPPTYWAYPSSYAYVSGFYWGAGIYIGPTFFYSSCGWHDRRVVVIDRQYPYRSEPRFYTGASIVRFEGAREWHHDPIHRHGVAYYNDSLRQTYGSPHESYKNDREYRNQFRDMSRTNTSPRIIRPSSNERNLNDNENDRVIRGRNVGADNNAASPTSVDGRAYDRADQLRERISRMPESHPISSNEMPNTSIATPNRNDANHNLEQRDQERRVEFSPPKVENNNERKVENSNGENKQRVVRGQKRDEEK